MNRKVVIRTGVGIVVGCLIAGGTFVFGNQLIKSDKDIFSQEKLSFINYAVGGNYITDTNNTDMTEGIYKGYVYGVEDVYTKYLTKEEFTKQKVESKGDYIGTGIRFAWGITNQYIIVTEVIPGSPAEEAGIEIGDKIVEIDNIKAMMSNEVQIYEKLTYTGDKPVSYKIESNDGTSSRIIDLVSRVIEIDFVKSEMLEAEIGYIGLDGLEQGTVEQVKRSLDTLKKEGATKVILDLRGTSSNNLEEVKNLCDLFLTEGTAFSVVDKNQDNKEYKTSQEYFEGQLVVITNYYTAGAIEGFVGAIKDLGRGKIVGEKTAGNGTIQELVELDDGSGLSITTGLIMTPKGIQIKGEGIEPDLTEYTPTANTIELVTTGKVNKENDLPLQKAIEILR